MRYFQSHHAFLLFVVASGKHSHSIGHWSEVRSVEPFRLVEMRFTNIYDPVQPLQC